MSSLDPTLVARRLKRIYSRGAVVSLLQRPPGGNPDDPALPELETYRNDPVGFCVDVLGVEILTDDQQAILRAIPVNGRVKVNSGHNTGKAQPYDLLIDTPEGRIVFGDLVVGDFVFGRDGKPTRVEGVFERGVLPQYRVRFDDGSSTLVAGDHLWTVRCRRGRRNPKAKGRGMDGWETIDTEELLRRGLTRNNGSPNGTLDWELPRHGAVQFDEVPIPIPAYTLGMWIGDGCTTSSLVTTADSEIVRMLASEAPEGIRVFPQLTKAVNVRVYGLKAKLASLGALRAKVDKKRVPSLYRYNSVAVRLAVLQGLMDSDGTCDQRGIATFTSTSPKLVEDVIWLVRSLGGKAQLQPTVKKPWYRDKSGIRIDCKPAYIATVILSEYPLFRLKRKQNRLKDLHKVRSRLTRHIASITPEGVAPMRCIMVAASDGLYLTNDFIVTHNTYLAACAVLWWFYTRPKSVVITTAPTERDVLDLLWTEIRLLHGRAKRPLPDYFCGPRAAEMYDNGDHWAKGYTARDAVSFQGRHRESMLYVFDESEGIPPFFWDVTGTSYKPGHDHGWLAIGNPVTTSSRSYLEDRAKDPDGNPKWRLFTLSALNHPNVLAELQGLSPPIPNAVSISQVDQWIEDWCEPIEATDKRPNDLEWPPNSGKWYRPGPAFLARGMGIRPVDGVDTIWGAKAWAEAIYKRHTPAHCWIHYFGITIGVDVASYGDDNSVFHVRTGPLSVHHEAHNGWGPQRIAERLKELCVEWAAWYNAQAQSDGRDRPPLTPAQVGVVVELDGPGAAVLDLCNGYGNWTGIKVAEASEEMDQQGNPKYSNKRAELWFSGRDKALSARMDLSRLPKDVQDRLETQLLTPAYKILPAGTMQVESKDDLKKRLKRSPDDADALLVSYCEATTWLPTVLFRQDR